jgi:indolepyruvate ferredoxin oxidoreductase beta subunit
MVTNIILAGVGGQGVLTLAGILDLACLNNNLIFKQSEVHGMSQRGGAVQSHVRISEDIIYSDTIPLNEADVIVATEPMELLRHLSFLKNKGWLITDSETVENIEDYPEKERLFEVIAQHKNHIIINATEQARKIGNANMSNMILLGMLSHFVPLKERALKAAIKSLFEQKGERIIQMNLEAFDKGVTLVPENFRKNEHSIVGR